SRCTAICSPTIPITPAPCSKVTAMARAMRKPDDDEDSLQREDVGPDERGAQDSLTVLYDALCRSSEAAVHNTMAIARCLENMVHAASRGDRRALKYWHDTCQGIVTTVGGE